MFLEIMEGGGSVYLNILRIVYESALIAKSVSWNHKPIKVHTRSGHFWTSLADMVQRGLQHRQDHTPEKAGPGAAAAARLSQTATSGRSWPRASVDATSTCGFPRGRKSKRGLFGNGGMV